MNRSLITASMKLLVDTVKKVFDVPRKVRVLNNFGGRLATIEHQLATEYWGECVSS